MYFANALLDNKALISLSFPLVVNSTIKLFDMLWICLNSYFMYKSQYMKKVKNQANCMELKKQSMLGNFQKVWIKWRKMWLEIRKYFL